MGQLINSSLETQGRNLLGLSWSNLSILIDIHSDKLKVTECQKPESFGVIPIHAKETTEHLMQALSLPCSDPHICGLGSHSILLGQNLLHVSQLHLCGE